MNVVLGDLPTWNLTDLYSSPTGTDLNADLKRAAAEAEAFARDYDGRIVGLDGKALAGAVVRLEAMSDLLGRIGSYAQLYSAQDLSDPERNRFAQDISEKLNDIGSKLLFFRLEINKIEDADLAEKLKAPELAKYGPWLRDARLFRTSSPTSSRSSSTTSLWSAAAPGRACSTRRSHGCVIRSATRC